MDNLLHQVLKQSISRIDLNKSHYQMIYIKKIVKRTLFEWALIFCILQIAIFTFQKKYYMYFIILICSAIIFHFRRNRSIVPLFSGIIFGLLLQLKINIQMALFFSMFNFISSVILIKLLTPMIENIQVKFYKYFYTKK